MSDVTDIAALRRDARTERFFGEMDAVRGTDRLEGGREQRLARLVGGGEANVEDEDDGGAKDDVHQGNTVIVRSRPKIASSPAFSRSSKNE